MLNKYIDMCDFSSIFDRSIASFELSITKALRHAVKAAESSGVRCPGKEIRDRLPLNVVDPFR